MASEPEPPFIPTPQDKTTADASQCSEEDREEVFRYLSDAKKKPPGRLGSDEPPNLQFIERSLKVVTQEISRQLGICISISAVRRTQDYTLESTHATCFPEGRPRAPDFAYGEYLFGSHMQDSYISWFETSPGTRVARVWPDFKMDDRPCLGPQHPAWKIERQTIEVFMQLLWLWQGGEGRFPQDWIIEDVNRGGDKYIKRARLPEHLLPFSPIHTWDAQLTYKWSNFLRRFNTPHGRLDPRFKRLAWQYRTITRADGSVLHVDDTFRNEGSPNSLKEMRYSSEATLYGHRITEQEDRRTARMSVMFSNEFQKILYAADESLGGCLFMSLWSTLREYELHDPAPGLDELFSSDKLPQPIMHVARESTRWIENAKVPRYPETFLSWTNQDWDRWTGRFVLLWLRQKPLTDKSTGLLYGGFNGVATAVVATIHLVLNLVANRAAPAPVNQSPTSSYKISEHDFDQVRHLVEEIQRQIDESLIKMKEASTTWSSAYLGDEVNPWKPKRWVRSTQGKIEPCDWLTQNQKTWDAFEQNSEPSLGSEATVKEGPNHDSKSEPTGKAFVRAMPGQAPAGSGLPDAACRTPRSMNDTECETGTVSVTNQPAAATTSRPPAMQSTSQPMPSRSDLSFRAKVTKDNEPLDISSEVSSRVHKRGNESTDEVREPAKFGAVTHKRAKRARKAK